VTLLKEIGADETLANVVLVLSDADAVFAMPSDRDRQNQIWVEDFDEPGAHAAPTSTRSMFCHATTSISSNFRRAIAALRPVRTSPSATSCSSKLARES